MKHDILRQSQELLIGYWQGFTTSGPPPAAPALRDTPACVDVICTAFAAPGTNSSIVTDYLTKKNSKADIIADTEILQSRGQKVVMSVNGSEQAPWSELEPIPFAKSVRAIAKDWKLDGIDLDSNTLLQYAASIRS